MKQGNAKEHGNRKTTEFQIFFWWGGKTGGEEKNKGPGGKATVYERVIFF